MWSATLYWMHTQQKTPTKNVHHFHFGLGLVIGKYVRSIESSHIDTKNTHLYRTGIKYKKKVPKWRQKWKCCSVRRHKSKSEINNNWIRRFNGNGGQKGETNHIIRWFCFRPESFDMFILWKLILVQCTHKYHIHIRVRIHIKATTLFLSFYYEIYLLFSFLVRFNTWWMCVWLSVESAT